MQSDAGAEERGSGVRRGHKVRHSSLTTLGDGDIFRQIPDPDIKPGKSTPVAFRSSIRTIATRYLLGLVVLCLLLAVPPSFALDSQDSQIFIAGFNAYQKKDYQTSIEKMSQVLQKYPDTQLRDMALFWLARANFKAGNRQDAARYMAQFFREYPESPLKGTVEDELASLATAYAKDEKSRVAGDKAESERLAKEKAQAEEERLASEKAEAEKVAAAKAEEDSRRVAAAEKAARKKAESERLAAEKAAAKKAEAERLAKEKAEAERLAKEKAAVEQDRLAAKKAAAELAAREKAEQEQLAANKAAAKKVETERLAKEKAETERLAKQKVLEERIRLAAEKAAAEKSAKEKAEHERLALEQAAKDKAEAERLAREKAAAERLAQAKASAEQNRLAMEKAEAEKAATEKSAQERRAARKAEEERHARQQAEAEQKRLAEKKAAAEQKRVAADKRAAAKAASGKRKGVLRAETARDKTIAEYKAIIDRAPASSAAEAASSKLKALGVDYPAGHVKAAARTKEPPATAQVLTLEVGQFADVEFTVATAGQAFPVGRRLMVPFEVLNRGNGADSFYLESGFPAEYGVQFVAEGKPDVPVNLTPQLAPGERFRGVMTLTIPRGTIDGQKISYPVKLASQYARDVSQSRQVTLIASAPLLRAVINTEKKEVVPGEKVTYRVALLNIGSAPASGVMLRLNYPPLYEAVDFIKAGFKQEMKAALVLDGIKLESGESRELTVTFQLKDEAIARQELFLRGDLINNELETSDSFVSALAQVAGISGVTARTTAERLVVIPGQTVTIPLIVTNTGNQREDFTIRPTMPDSLSYTVYQDLNRDGIRQPNEPVINHVGPLAPREEAYVVFELKTPSSESDGSVMPMSVAFEPESVRSKSALVNLKIAYSRPLVELAMTGRGGRLRPGEVATFDLTCINRGSSIARVVELQTILPEALELVASDPAVSRGRAGEYAWKFEELGAGEKKGARVSIRVKSGVAVGTNLQVKNLLRYQDQLGNTY